MAEPRAEREVAVRDADGRRGFVRESDVPQLIASGGSLETEESLAAEAERAARKEGRAKLLENITSPVQQYLGYQEALARGATLGLSDLALTEGLGDEYRQGAQARAANPITALPELAGAGGAMVAGELLAGPVGGAAGAARGLGALGRLGQVVTAPGRALAAAGRGGEALGVAGAEALGLGQAGSKGLGLLGRGAAEGALAGAGAEVSAASLEDRDLVVDKLLAAAGHGALAGGGLNVALGGAGRLGRAGLNALEGMASGSGLSESIQSFANRRAFKAGVGNAQRYYDEATNYGRDPERIERIGQKLLATGVTRETLSDLPALRRSLDGVLEQRGQQLRAIADQLDAQGTRVSPGDILPLVDEQIARMRAAGLPDFDAVARKLDRQVARMRARAAEGQDYGFGEFWEFRRNFDKTIKWASDQRSPARDELKRLRGIFDDALDNAADDVPLLARRDPGLAESYAKVVRGQFSPDEWNYIRGAEGQREGTLRYLRSAYTGAPDVNAVATGRVTPAGFSRPLDPIKVVVEPGGPPVIRDGTHRLGVAEEMGATEIRAQILAYDTAGNALPPVERIIPMPGRPRTGPDLRGAWLAAKEDFSDFRIVRDAAHKASLREEKNRFTSPSDYFSGGMAFLSAVMSGGSALAALATAAGASMVNKVLREKGPGAIARMADRIAKFDARTDAAIAAAIDGNPKGLPELPKRTVPLLAAMAAVEGETPIRTTSDQRERFEQTLRLVRDLGSEQPSREATARLGNATASLADDFPELAALLNERVIAAARALNARAPIPLQRTNPLQQHLEARRVPAGLVAKWLREVDALDTPESIWHDLAKGRVPREKIELIKETQPYLWEDWRGRVMRMVAERGEKLGRPQRIRLSLAFDFTGDPSIDPMRIAQIQSEYAAQKQAEQTQPQGPSGGANLSTQQADDMKAPTEQTFLQAG